MLHLLGIVSRTHACFLGLSLELSVTIGCCSSYPLLRCHINSYAATSVELDVNGYQAAVYSITPPNTEATLTVCITFSVTIFWVRLVTGSTVVEGVASSHIRLICKSSARVVVTIPVGFVAVPTAMLAELPAEGDGLALELGLTEAEGLPDAEGERERLEDEDGDRERLELAEGLSEGELLELGERLAEGLVEPLGDVEGESEELGEVDVLGDVEALIEAETLEDGL